MEEVEEVIQPQVVMTCREYQSCLGLFRALVGVGMIDIVLAIPTAFFSDDFEAVKMLAFTGFWLLACGVLTWFVGVRNRYYE